jgi:hypothetical protein
MELHTLLVLALTWIWCGFGALILENEYLKKKEGQDLIEKMDLDFEVAPFAARIGYFGKVLFILFLGLVSLLWIISKLQYLQWYNTHQS